MMRTDEKQRIYFTITGLFAYLGSDFIKPDMEVQLEKDPDNQYDNEAIMVKLPGIGKIGYVANSVKTVFGDEAYSAGRLYDKFNQKATGKVLYNMGNTIQCEFIR